MPDPHSWRMGFGGVARTPANARRRCRVLLDAGPELGARIAQGRLDHPPHGWIVVQDEDADFSGTEKMVIVLFPLLRACG